MNLEEIDPFDIPVWADYLEKCIAAKNLPLFYKKFWPWFILTQKIVANDLQKHVLGIEGDIIGQKQREIWKRCKETEMANEAKKRALEREKDEAERKKLKNSNVPVWKQRL